MSLSTRLTAYGFGSSAEAPTASFTASPSAFPLGGSISFTDTSTGTPIRWLWIVTGGAHTFIGGTDENSQNPEIRFFEDVTYTVYLRAWNVYGTSLASNFYQKAVPVPVASFTISDATPNVGQIVTFTDTSTNTPTSWSWAISPSTYVFEGGTSATSQNPQVAFLDESTNYTVNLTATNASGSDSTTFTNNVVSNALEAVHFEYDPYLYGDADDEGVTAPTTYQTPTYNSEGYYDFDGGNNGDGFEYDTPNGINDTDGSIEIWCQPDQVANPGFPFTASQDTTDDFRFELGQAYSNPEDMIFYIKGANGSVFGRIDITNVFAAGEWVHIVVTRKAGVPLYSTAAAAFDVYINGSLVTTGISKTGSGYWLEYIDGRTPWNISVGGYVLNNSGNISGGFDGKIGRAAIYQTPLTATRISENYNWLSKR